MNVYYNGNGDIWSRGRAAAKLTAVPVCKTFLWGKQEVSLPAVYIGQAGVVLDVCTKIPAGNMILFLKKWDKDKRLMAKTKEEFDQLDADNPAAREFTAGLHLDGTALTNRTFSSIRWYPEEIFASDSVQGSGERLENNKTAEEMMSVYGCDRKCCWHFERLAYDWTTEPILTPTELSLSLQARPFPVTAEHFTTKLSCGERNFSHDELTFSGSEQNFFHDEQPSSSEAASGSVSSGPKAYDSSSSHEELPDKEPVPLFSEFPANLEVTHPTTGQKFVLTLHGLEQTRHSFTNIGRKGFIYPEYCQILSYSVSPGIGCELFDILDCADGDQPRPEISQNNSSGNDCGPVAIFMAGKNPAPAERSSCSSLHFKPVSTVRWRVVFQVKEKEDMTFTLPLSHADLPSE